MADGTITERIVLDYAQAISASKALATEAHAVATAQRQIAESARVAESGLRRLEDLAASTATERAALAYRRQAAEIDALAKATGNQALADRAMARLNAEAAERLTVSAAATARLADAHGTAAVAAQRSAVSHGQLAAGMTNLGNQVADVAVQLAGGASPALVLMQQGPQIAAAAASMGGLGATMSALGTAAAAAAPLLAAAGIAVAALGTGYAVWANATTDAASEARDAKQALIEQTEAARPAADAVKKLADEWKGYLSLSADIQSQIALINGQLTEGQASAARQAARLDAAAKSNLEEQGREVARLSVALQAAQALSTDTTASAATRADSSGQIAGLEEQLVKAREKLAATKAQIAADKEAAGAAGEYADAQRQAEEFLRKRAEAEQKAAEAAREAARAQEAMWRGIQAEIAGAADAAAAVLVLRDAERALSLSRGEVSEATFQRMGTAARADQLANLQPVQIGGYGSAEVQKQRDAMAKLATTIANDAAAFEAHAETVRRSTADANASRATGIVNTVSAGPEAVLGMVGAATGPIGMLVTAIVGAVVHLEDTIASFQSFHEGLWDTIGRLPDIMMTAIRNGILDGMVDMVDGLVGFVESLASNLDDILRGLVESIPRITGAIVEALLLDLPAAVGQLVKTILSPALWKELIVGLWQGFVDVIKTTFGAVVESFRRAFDDFIQAIKDVFTVFDEGLFPQGGPTSVGDFLGDALLGPNRQGVLADLWSGPQGGGGVSNLFGLINTRTAADGASSPASTARTASATSRQRSGVTVNAGFVFGGRAGLRELSDAIATDQAISRYGWAG